MYVGGIQIILARVPSIPSLPCPARPGPALPCLTPVFHNLALPSVPVLSCLVLCFTLSFYTLPHAPRYGVMVVEPEGGMPPVDKEFYVVQNEFYGEESSEVRGGCRFRSWDTLGC